MKGLEPVRINDNDTPVSAAARLEAMMTFKKRAIKDENSEILYLEKRIVKTKEQTFNFGRIFGITLKELEAGLRKLPREIEEMFS